jgi:putative addiction module component (TIGR02574 family)
VDLAAVTRRKLAVPKDIIKQVAPGRFAAGQGQSKMRDMASIADRLLDEALKLTPDERARIVAELLATLEPDLPSQRRSGEEWIQEIERRARAAMAGDDPGVPWAEAHDQIRGRLSAP